MRGGNIKFQQNKWVNFNYPGSKHFDYSQYEIDALNTLNIGVTETNNTNSYNLDKKIWFFLNKNPSDIYTLFEISPITEI